MGSAGDDPDRKSDYGLKGDTSSPRFIPRVEVEVEAEAFLAHTAYQLKEIAKLSGADRDHAIDLVAAKIGGRRAAVAALQRRRRAGRQNPVELHQDRRGHQRPRQAAADHLSAQRQVRPTAGRPGPAQRGAAVRRGCKLPVFTSDKGRPQGQSMLDGRVSWRGASSLTRARMQHAGNHATVG